MSDKSKPLSPRDLYRHSRDKVNHCLKILGGPKQDTTSSASLDRDYDMMIKLVENLVTSQQTEGDNDYRIAILQVSNWIRGALTKEFITQNSKVFPTPLYVIKKGFETLHLLLHRDLRRRQLSSTESQLFYEFVSLTGKFPKPPFIKLGEDLLEDSGQQKARSS